MEKDKIRENFLKTYSHFELWQKKPQNKSPHKKIPEEAKQRARMDFYCARKKGLITRKPCEVCGSSKKINAHHEDYSKPLEVIWLCSRHHGERHREINGLHEVKPIPRNVAFLSNRITLA